MAGRRARKRPAGKRSGRLGLLGSIWRRKEIVAICTLVVPAVVLFFSLREEPTYEATATFLVRGQSGEEPPSPTEVIDLARADAVAEGTGEELGGLDPASIVDRTTVSTPDGSDVFEVEASAEEPASAASLATTFTEQFVDYTKELGDAFTGRAELVQSAAPPEGPVSPRSVRNTLIGAVVGLIIGLVAAVLRERLDPRVGQARELDALLGAPLIGRVPKSPALALDPGLLQLPAADAEAFQMARVSIRYLDVEPEVRSVLVTSAGTGDGKTAVALGLAIAAATGGDSVIVIEADMRQPSLAAVTEPTSVGLSNVLEGTAALGEALTAVEVAVGPESVLGTIDVLQAGRAPSNPTPLLESEAMSDLLAEVEPEYDLVVVDTPPAAIIPDAIPLMGRVDGVVVVAGLGRDRRDDLRELRERLEQVNAPLIGTIANFAASRDDSYFEHIRAHEAAVAAEEEAPLRAVGRTATPPADAPAARRARSRRSQRRQRPSPVEVPVAVRLPDGPVDLNEVTYEELRALDLSTTQAKRLIAYRERQGGFSSVDDIDDVPGFPDELRDGLKRRVTV
jgi:capsular exopolysaccharide synthesis family protein